MPIHLPCFCVFHGTYRVTAPYELLQFDRPLPAEAYDNAVGDFEGVKLAPISVTMGSDSLCYVSTTDEGVDSRHLRIHFVDKLTRKSIYVTRISAGNVIHSRVGHLPLNQMVELKEGESISMIEGLWSYKLSFTTESYDKYRYFVSNTLVLCFGEVIMDHRQTLPASAPANAAACIGKFGGKSAFIGRVGNDEYGMKVVDMLKNHNVDTSRLSVVETGETGLEQYMFMTRPDHLIICETDLKFNAALDCHPIIKRSVIFHYDSISVRKEPCISALVRALDVAQKSHSILCFNANVEFTLPFWSSKEIAQESIRLLCSESHIIKVSEDEVRIITGGDDPKQLLYPRVLLLLVCDGKNGCRYYTQKFSGSVPSFEVPGENQVDRTGCGDAFFGAFLFCLANDLKLYESRKRLRKAIMLANVCGALTLQKVGAIPALPMKYEVDMKIKELKRMNKQTEMKIKRRRNKK